MNLIGDAVAVVLFGRVHDGVEARLGVLGVENLRVGVPGRDLGDVGNEQHRGGVGAPLKDIAVDAPVVGDFADRIEDLGRVDGSAICAGTDRIARTGVGHGRLFEDCCGCRRIKAPLSGAN